jgi:hypothetical protein
MAEISAPTPMAPWSADWPVMGLVVLDRVLVTPFMSAPDPSPERICLCVLGGGG